MMNKPSSYLSPRLTVKERAHKGGHGVFANQMIASGELLAIWGGEVVTLEQFSELPRRTQQLSVQIEDRFYLVPSKPGEPADYINHSCDPNAGMDGQIAVVAMHEILPGEEICIDYAMCDGSPYDEFECACGTSRCRGTITGNDWQRKELWARYEGYFSPYLQRRVHKLILEEAVEQPLDVLAAK